MLSRKVAWTFSIGTFLFGMFADSWLELQQELPSVEIDHTYQSRNPHVALNGKIQVELMSVRSTGGRQREATFKVTNRMHEPVGYSGYFEGNTAQAWIRQNGRIRESIELECWNGVETQTLEPTNTTYFTIPIPPRGDFFDVGFDFRIGHRIGWETVWFRFPEYPNPRRKA